MRKSSQSISFTCMFALACFCLPSVAKAAVDAPCVVRVDFLAEENIEYRSFADVPEDAPFSLAEASEAFASSDASSFGMDGALLFAGFILDAPGGQRYGMLSVDIDLANMPDRVDDPMPKSAIRARYLEMQGDDVLFRGSLVAGDVWMVDWYISNGDKGAIEGDFAFIFEGEQGGCRVLERGMFLSQPSPVALRNTTGGRDDSGSYDDDEYSSVGCDGDVIFLGDSGGCGGEDPNDGSSGCEGDTSSDSGGCNGDSSSSSAGCEGDSSDGGCSGSGSSGCDNSGDSGACSSSQANAATLSHGHHRHGASLIGAVMRMFPELTAFMFIFWLKRRGR